MRNMEAIPTPPTHIIKLIKKSLLGEELYKHLDRLFGVN